MQVLPCLVKQLANSAFVVSTAAAECLMEVLNFTAAPCLFMRLAALYDPSASLKVRSSLLRALVLPLKQVTIEKTENFPATSVQSFALDESFISVGSATPGGSWRAKVVRTLQRVLAVDASAELRVLAKGALKHLNAPTRSPQITTCVPESPRSLPQKISSDAEIERALDTDHSEMAASLRAALCDAKGTVADKTWAKVLTVALETRNSEIISLVSRRDDARRFLAGFQELINHTFPGIVLFRGV